MPNHRPRIQRLLYLLMVFVLTFSLASPVDSARKNKKQDENEEPEVKQEFPVSDPSRTGRSMSIVENGMVASAHYLASLAGVDMLRQGGSAMDAAIATAATLAVVEPMMTGMGGDVFILYYEAKTGKVHALNGSGRSPMNLSRAHFEETGQSEIKTDTWEAVTVPGAVDAYLTAHERFGTLPLETVFGPAIGYARDGFPVAEKVGTMWSTQVGKLRRDEWSTQLWLTEDEKAPEIGSRFAVPELAKTMETIVAGGRDAFYEGPIAQEIVRHAQATGGFLTMEDFAAHRSEWVDPISTGYRGYEVYQCPPNGQGIAVLMLLNILEGYDLGGMELGSPEYWHLFIEAKKLVWADLGKYIADPDNAEIPLDTLLSKEYAAERRKEIDPDTAMDAADPGIPQFSDTTTFVTIDSDGNAVAFINSLFAAFGSGKTGGNTGIMLQNRGEGFTLERGHANEYAPGKRPFQTIIPGLVTKDEKLYMVYGLMGGSLQPQGHVQLLTSHIDHGLNIQEAVDLPRWRHMDEKTVRCETGTPDWVREGLEAMGHNVLPGNYLLFGSAQVIMVDPDTGLYWGASDSRRDGIALGY